MKTTSGASGPVSPLAQTVPLAADPRTTDGLPGEDPRRSADTVRVSNGDLDAILQGRHVAQPRTAAVKDGDGSSAPLPDGHFAAPTTSSLVMPAKAGAQKNVPSKKRWWPIVLVSLFLVALAGALLIYYFTHRGRGGEPAVVTTDQSRTVESQLAEARSFLAAGNIDEAANRLHSVIDLDPSNVEAHRLLGQALMRKGLRRQAIDEYFIAAQKDPKDLPTLHALASLQFQEHLYADAVDSYRRLIAAMGEATLAPQDQLDYADALRFAGYTEDARNEYQKVIATAPPDIVATAKKHLAQLPAPTATSTQGDTRPSTTGTPGTTSGSTTSAVPAPTTQVPATAKPSPSPAQSNPDADYSLGVSIVGGRDPKNIPRADLLRALGILQRASRGGQHRAQAQSLAERLGQEFDRRRRLGIQ
ncbi:MAG: tetratricopeptide repeat protein [Pyrinomonadaceae bacterium]